MVSGSSRVVVCEAMNAGLTSNGLARRCAFHRERSTPEDMVSSPGGTTIAGITALEEGGVRRTFIGAVERATLRSRELGGKR